MALSHAERIAELSTNFSDSMTRFLARVERATPESLMKKPDEGGWSAGEVAWHVGAINNAFAGLIDGSVPSARPAPEGFVETPWTEIALRVPAKLDAPPRFHPPADLSAENALDMVRHSKDKMLEALSGLTEERALGFTVKSSVGTPVNLYQVGTWAAAHVARHNAQVKKLIG
jgi:uncharacterized damage-inducible protein DinB